MIHLFETLDLQKCVEILREGEQLSTVSLDLTSLCWKGQLKSNGFMEITRTQLCKNKLNPNTIEFLC